MNCQIRIMMYTFERLGNKMDTWGFPKLEIGSGFRIIRTDFEEAYKAGDIRFGDDGIYLEYEGKEHRGYMYIKEPWITQYKKYPKFHLTKCKTIDEFIHNGKFKIRYEWSNSNINDLIDKTTRKEFKDEVLSYCSNCKKKIFEEIDDSEDFFNTLDTESIEESSIEVDIFGYEKDWQKISKAYRKKMDFTCEECGLKIENRLDQRYLHTHHKDGNKTNNKVDNLECVCVLCHSKKNARHMENFKKGRMNHEMEAFKNRYINAIV